MSRERQTATLTKKLLPKKKQTPTWSGPVGCCCGCSLSVLCFLCFSPCFAQSGLPWRRCFVAAGSSALRFGVSLCLGAASSYKGGAMSIQGEVRVRKMHWLPLASFNEGRYVIRPFECSVTGNDEGYAPVKASKYTCPPHHL